MAEMTSEREGLRIDPDSFAGGHFRHAVHNTWDPYGDVSQEALRRDRENLIEADVTREQFVGMLQILARFGAGEEAVTEDLTPLLGVLDDIDDQMFVASQVYDEALHTEFFDRYWREVVLEVAERTDWPALMPTDERFFNESYVELFDRTERAMSSLEGDSSPANRVRAYCHYHIGIESILAQTGYWNITKLFGPDETTLEVAREMPDLPGLVEGIRHVRADEGRHVGFGMHKIQHHVANDDVAPDVVADVLETLMPLIAESVAVDASDPEDDPVVDYARAKLEHRLDVILDEEADVPPAEELVELTPTVAR
ncbi:ribonucleoside-diphosphate reductase [Halomicrobium salinisoli]|uniref:ribonucleoside-diphosphate reductase n=1 Tax=Halomicrobium salinisoli TaxID=2878391 RepID=UPI001CF0943F|nr:ribonucleoside-diphosphate reductase [Halomicrobium salinisoli]